MSSPLTTTRTPTDALAAGFARLFPPLDAPWVPVVATPPDGITVPLTPSPVLPDILPVTVHRSVDLVDIEFAFAGLRLVDGQLSRTTRGRPGFLIATFGPQHVLEQAFFDAGVSAPPPIPPDTREAAGTETPVAPVRASLAKPSRIVYRVDGQSVAYSEAGLLQAMLDLPLAVAPHADAPPVLFVPVDVAATLPLRAATQRLLTRKRRTDGLVAPGILTPSAVDGLVTATRTAIELEQRFGAASAAGALGTVDVNPTRIPLPRIKPAPRAPEATETAIELPWRLQLSPASTGAFVHSPDPVEHGGRVELWHSRLGARVDRPGGGSDVVESDPSRTGVRAIWTRDFDQPGSAFTAQPAPADFPPLFENQPFRASLNRRDRMQIVHQTSNFAYGGGGRNWAPTAVEVDGLAVSALGGWLDSDLRTRRDASGTLSLAEWEHRATQGRDHFVKVVTRGVLYPFGHRAALVKITERRLREDVADRHAYLFQRLYVVVLEPERQFRATGSPAEDRKMPFSWVRILTPSTPPLADPEPDGLVKPATAFIPKVLSEPGDVKTPFAFRFAACDVDGRIVEFEGPMEFFDESGLPPNVDGLKATFSKVGDAVGTYALHGQRVAFAVHDDVDDTTLSVTSLTFHATATPSVVAQRQAGAMLPVLHTLSAPVPAMAAMTGQSGPLTLEYPQAYLDGGFDTGNWSAVFLQLTAAATLDFGSQSDRSGGFVSPSVAVSALARKIGPVGGAVDALTSNPGAFSVGTMFDLSQAKLFGALSLTDLLASAADTAVLPSFVTKVLGEVTALHDDLVRLREFATGLSGQASAIRDAAVALVARTDEFLADLSAFAAAGGTGAAPDFAGELGRIATAATTLDTAIGASDLGLARPVREQAHAVLLRVGDVASDGARVVPLVEQFCRGLKLPEKVSARIDWSAPLQDWPSGDDAIFQLDSTGDKRLHLVAEVQAPTGGGAPSTLISCSLPPFRLRLVGSATVVVLHITTMEFQIASGKKPDVNVALADSDGIRFVGPLAFVQTLKDVIPFDGFSDPPYLDISPSGITAGFDLAIPDLAVGIFSLSNIKVAAEVDVPFIGESLSFRFAFSTRDDPFRIAVSLFAGGGFFGITISPKGLKVIEAAFEFGGAVELNFVVASGSVSIMAGIYFRLEVIDDEHTDVDLYGYLRARGEVDVLGLISACIEISIQLGYQNRGGIAKAYGRASISVEVSVCFLSFSVEISYEKTFSGAQGDPTFAAMMGPFTAIDGTPVDPWAEYCEAFA